jgi:hypothetical protein
MAATAKWYSNAVVGVFSATAARRFDWVNDTIKVTLHTSAYAYNQFTNTYYSDLASELATGSGYVAGGYTMVNKTLTYDGASKEVRLDADDPQWTAATFTFRTYVIRKDTGTPSTSPLLGFGDMGADQSISGGTYTLVGDPTGWLKDVVS